MPIYPLYSNPPHVNGFTQRMVYLFFFLFFPTKVYIIHLIWLWIATDLYFNQPKRISLRLLECQVLNRTFIFFTYIPFRIQSSVTKWLDCFCNIWPFTTNKICPINTNFLPNWVQNLTKLNPEKNSKEFKNFTQWWVNHCLVCLHWFRFTFFLFLLYVSYLCVFSSNHHLLSCHPSSFFLRMASPAWGSDINVERGKIKVFSVCCHMMWLQRQWHTLGAMNIHIWT